MRDRIKLNPGEKLKLESSRRTGTMDESDIDTYSIINQAGEVVGSVVHTDHTALRGFKEPLNNSH